MSSSSAINIFLQQGVMMTEQELDQIINLIPQATRHQAEVLLGQLHVHTHMLDKEHKQTPRYAPLAPMSPFENDGDGGYTREAMQQSRLREIQNSAAGRKTTAVNNMITRQKRDDNEWSGG